MSAHPSASLNYGIDLGIQEESDWPWLTDELEEEYGGPAEVLDHLLKDIPKVGHDHYGNFLSGYLGMSLCTQGVSVCAYEVKAVDLATLTGTAEDDRYLREAWAVLYPGTLMPEPVWHIVLSYG